MSIEERCILDFIEKPLFIIMFGRSGEGKSYTAKNLIPLFGNRIYLIKTDDTRFEMQKQGLIQPPLYTKENMKKVYDYIFNGISEKIKEKNSVLFDATFLRKDLRKRAFDIALNNELAYFFILKMSTSQEIVKKRFEMQKIRPDPNNESEATYKTYLEQSERIELFDDEEKKYVIEINGNLDHPYNEAYRKILKKLDVKGYFKAMNVQ